MDQTGGGSSNSKPNSKSNSKLKLRSKSRTGGQTLHLKLVAVPEPLRHQDLRLSHSPGSITSFTEDILSYLAYHRAYRVLWINRADEISLGELHSAGIDLTKLTFATAANAFLSLKNSLKDGRHPILIAPETEFSRTQLEELKPLLLAAHAELVLLR